MFTLSYRLKYAGYWLGGYLMRGIDLTQQVVGSVLGTRDSPVDSERVLKLGLNPIQWSAFDESVAEWRRFAPSKSEFSKLPTNNTNIKIATFNVLTNDLPFMDEIVCTSERFRYICETLLPSLNADVICLNEVTHDFLPWILYQEWAMKDFVLSNSNATQLVSRSNLILSRKEIVRRLFVEESPSSRPAIVAEICWNAQLSDGSFASRSLLVTSVHLTAYEQRYAARKAQLERLTSSIKSFQQEERKSHCPVLILGDFNFHSEAENTSMSDQEYADVWTLLRGQEGPESGFTYDPVVNTMITRVYPPERRRMRLDRCFLSRSHTKEELKASTIKKFATAVIPESSFVRAGTFPSDHFGLLVELSAV